MSRLPLLSPDELEQALREARTIAVLGIKPESREQRAAHAIPAYLQQAGYRIQPVPLYYEDVHEILDEPVMRNLRALPEVPDILSVFVRADRITEYRNDILALKPPLVWFQSGLMDRDLAVALVEAGIRVAHDCIGCRRASIRPVVGRPGS